MGVETGKKVIGMRRKLRDLIALAAGKAIHPVFGLPGGVAKPLTAKTRNSFRTVAAEAVEFARFTLDVFERSCWRTPTYVELIRSDCLHPPDLLHGHGGRAQPGELL